MLSVDVRARARERAVAISDEIAALPNVEWRGIAGCAGDALLHWAALHATGDQRFERALHASLQRAARFDGDAGAGLYTGVAGIQASASLATDFEARYDRLVERCEQRVAYPTLQGLKKPECFYEFDVIAGWAGVRLARHVRGPGDGDALSDALVWLVEDWERWKCPHPEDPRRLPVHDMGVAHGICGVLATLALTYDRPREHEREAILACARRVLSTRRESGAFSAWPHSLEHEHTGDYRSAWCYGTCGVVAALHAVGVAYDAPDLAREAAEIAVACASAGLGAWRIHELGLCHGVMGNILCFASIASDGERADLAGHIEPLVTHVLDELDDNGGRCWSYKGDERYAATNELLGTAGIALALFTLAGDSPSDWMRIHGLRPI